MKIKDLCETSMEIAATDVIVRLRLKLRERGEGEQAKEREKNRYLLNALGQCPLERKNTYIRIHIKNLQKFDTYIC